jgi:hypothetical protein
MLIKEMRNGLLKIGTNFLFPILLVRPLLSNAIMVKSFKMDVNFFITLNALNSIFKVYKRVNHKFVFIDSIKIHVFEFREASAWLGGKSGKPPKAKSPKTLSFTGF